MTVLGAHRGEPQRPFGRTNAASRRASAHRTRRATGLARWDAGVLQVAGLVVAVRHSARRRTLELRIDAEGRLRVTAPASCEHHVIEAFIVRRLDWIRRKLAEKANFKRRFPGSRFEDGETFRYLGRAYRLQIVDDQDAPLLLRGGRFRLLRTEQARAREHFLEWYGTRGGDWLRRRIGDFVNLIGVAPLEVRVRDYRSRWGSCSGRGRLGFHWAVLTMPPAVIEYLIVHELVHLKVPGHGRRFWRSVERLMPDYAERRAWLRDHGAEYATQLNPRNQVSARQYSE